MELPEIETRNLVFVIAAIVIIVVGSVAVSQNVVATYETGEMNLGYADCAVELGVVAMKDGEVLNSPILNNPLYLDGIEVDALLCTIKLIATGEDVDWNTLAATISLSVNNQHLISWSWTILDFSVVTDGYEAFKDYEIEELDYLVGSVPDKVEDGIGYFTIQAEANCYADIMDLNGNQLHDSVKVINAWELTDTSTAVAAPLIPPEIVDFPIALHLDYEESFTLTWVAEDDNPSTYMITSYSPFLGTTTESSGYWISGQDISFNGKALYRYLTLGTGADLIEVTFTLEVFDDDGQKDSYSTYIKVEEPIIVEPDYFEWDEGYISPEGTVSAGSYEVIMTFKPIALENSPDSYIIYLNGEQIDAGTWSGGDISFYYDLEVETGVTYQFQCKVFDSEEKSDWYNFFITGERSSITDVGTGDDPIIINSPFYIEALGTSGTILFYGIIISIPAVWYIRRMRDED